MKQISNKAERTRRHRFGTCRTVVAGIVWLFLQACSVPKQTLLMPTPALYEGNTINAFRHVEPSSQNTDMAVFYASGRKPVVEKNALPFGNDVDDFIHFGQATVRFGEGDMAWSELIQASTVPQRENPVTIHLQGIEPLGKVAKVVVPDDPDADIPTAPAVITPDMQPFFDAINRKLAVARKKEIVIYVHGTKVDFLNAVTLTAELDHFTDRSFVTLAYDWPSHQNILDYLVGIDKQRAIDASYQFKNTLALLAEHTQAQKIHVVSYSAGGRVLSRALYELRLEHLQMTRDELKSHYRIGTVIFAAADVEVDRFLTRLEYISDLSEWTVVTISDADDVLEHARQIMGGTSRIGSVDAESLELDFIARHHLLNVQIVDVSSHKEQRGFDIGGHHYWYRHPWMSSDIIFLLQHGSAPDQRALLSSEETGIWYFGPDYPNAVREAALQKQNRPDTAQD